MNQSKTTMNQLEIINAFTQSAKYHLVKFETKNELDYGKILKNEELFNMDVKKHEIHRSIEYLNNDVLFIYNLKPLENTYSAYNPLELLLDNLREARVIESVYPGIFRWIFDGLSIKACAIIPSGTQTSQGTLSRYGGTFMFLRILRQHLNNIGKMNKGVTPDYNFLNNSSEIAETEMALGSVNMFTGLHSIGINLTLSPVQILKNSKDNKQIWRQLNLLNMKYWTREINPDFIVEAKHIKLNKTIPTDETLVIYPPCVKMLMNIPHKGNLNRFLLARFLLSLHISKDAKFMYEYVMGEEEREHVKNGNCSSQWNYIHNNMKRYECPNCVQMKRFCDKQCKMSHPLELIQKRIEEKKERVLK